ncbi:DMT family transporter [Castellaniella caeni]|uniref:DMT family transporter n=1 Tax=Castellaniella caeni TaxID=266123 RepID=UPI00082BAED4|nr:DMT family transporter [Castellaniella caeni]
MAEISRRLFWTGFVLAGLGAVLFSAKAIVAKLLYLHGVDALDVIGFRMLLAFPFFAVIAWFQARRARQGLIARLGWRDSLRICLLGFIGYYLSSFLDFLGLQYISAGLERLILFLAPTFVLLISAWFLKKPISSRQWLAMALAYGGVALVFWDDLSVAGEHVILGSACVLGAAFSYAMYLIGSGELIERVTATRLTAYAMTVSTVVTMAHFFTVKGWAGLDQAFPVYWLSFIHATLNTVLPTFMIMWSVARIGAPLTAQLGLLGPVSILFLAWAFLGEPITTLQVLGTVLVAAAALVLGRRSGAAKKGPAAQASA